MEGWRESRFHLSTSIQAVFAAQYAAVITSCPKSVGQVPESHAKFVLQVKYFCNETFELGLYGKAIDAYQVWVLRDGSP